VLKSTVNETQLIGNNIGLGLIQGILSQMGAAQNVASMLGSSVI
jgi:hypothetical protein